MFQDPPEKLPVEQQEEFVYDSGTMAVGDELLFGDMS